MNLNWNRNFAPQIQVKHMIEQCEEFSMSEPYQDVDNWSRERLEEELEYLHRDKLSGTMSEELYRECYSIILDELLKREDEYERQEAYKRAMKGI